MTIGTSSKVEKDFGKLRGLYIQLTKEYHNLTLRYNRLKHENRAMKLELDALKRRTGNG